MGVLLLTALLALVGCAPLHQKHVCFRSEREQGDARVGQCLSSEWSFQTSSFWLEGPEGLVLIDTQFLPSALRKEQEYAEPHTGKGALAGHRPAPKSRPPRRGADAPSASP